MMCSTPRVSAYGVGGIDVSYDPYYNVQGEGCVPECVLTFTAATRDHVGVLRVGERAENALAQILLGAAVLRLRHLRSLDVLQFALDVLHGEIARRARAHIAQAREQLRNAIVATRRGGDGFP